MIESDLAHVGENGLGLDLDRYGDLRLGQGRDNAKVFLRENPDLADEIETKIRERMGMPSLSTAPLNGVAVGE